MASNQQQELPSRGLFIGQGEGQSDSFESLMMFFRVMSGSDYSYDCIKPYHIDERWIIDTLSKGHYAWIMYGLTIGYISLRIA